MKTVGIDFGTTNSSVALFEDNKVRTILFPALTGASASSRSLLYFQQKKGGQRRNVSAWTGAEAIEQYLVTDSFSDEVNGRLIQSLKSYLSTRSLTGTEIFGRQYRFEDLVSRMLRSLRQRASEDLGFEVTHAVAGRPVNFVGADTEVDNDFATERLRTAFHEAGFEHVTFAMEPVAAAYAYQPSSSRDELLLIGDFGGGTTDFSLLRTRVQAGLPPEVIANAGVGLAGDAFDARIVRQLVSPALGSHSMARSLNKTLPALPAWVYANLERWHTLSFLRTHAVMEMLRTTRKRALEPEKIDALIAVVEHDLGYRLHQAVQRVKIDLSARTEAEFRLSTEAIDLRTQVKRSDFEHWIAPEVAQIGSSLDELLARGGVTASSVDRVFLTGGTSLVPAVQQVFIDRFGSDRMEKGEAFTSVAQGLARMAATA